MGNVVDLLLKQIGTILLGKEHESKLAVACLFAKGHLLIEDLPGMGKTTLAHCLANVLGLQFERVQFTSDLLPSDILGVDVYNNQTGRFDFKSGPIFTQLLLADEINRSTPKTQSALLEAMEESQVTHEGKTRPLPNPFFVIATQNPQFQSGTYPLPESQLDRFLMRLSLGYPSKKSEMLLLKGVNPRDRLAQIKPILSVDQLVKIQAHIRTVKTSDTLLDYVYRLVAFTRVDGQFSQGVSPRGALGLISVAKAWAFIHQRDYVVPEDIQAVAEPVLGHRLVGGDGVSASQSAAHVRRLFEGVDVVVS